MLRILKVSFSKPPHHIYLTRSTQSTAKRKRNGIIESQNHSYTIII